MTFYHSPNGLYDYIGPAPDIVANTEHEKRIALLGFKLESVKFGSRDIPLRTPLKECDSARVEVVLSCRCGRLETAVGTMPIRDGMVNIWFHLWKSEAFTPAHLRADGMDEATVQAAEYLWSLPFKAELDFVEAHGLLDRLKLGEALGYARNYLSRNPI